MVCGSSKIAALPLIYLRGAGAPLRSPPGGAFSKAFGLYYAFNSLQPLGKPNNITQERHFLKTHSLFKISRRSALTAVHVFRRSASTASWLSLWLGPPGLLSHGWHHGPSALGGQLSLARLGCGSCGAGAPCLIAPDEDRISCKSAESGF